MSALLLLVVLGVVGLLGLAVQVWALVDALRQPDGALDRVGGRTLWTALLAVALVLPGAGALLALVYLVAVRPRRVPG